MVAIFGKGDAKYFEKLKPPAGRSR